MGKLYVFGGRQRELGLKEMTYEEEWSRYESALIAEVDPETREIRICVEYQSPREARAGDKPSANFHSGAIVGDTLYTCTTTEVLIYHLPAFRLTGYISLPCFNDVHHVTPTTDGNLLVVSTGLDMVVKVSRKGEVLEEWSALADEALWTRFSRTIDYRQVATTKPHRAHPNYVFELGGELWVTRFYQRDAISLNDSHNKIELGGEMPHDGIVHGDRIYFTAVDGKIAVVNRETLKVEHMVDLREIQDKGYLVLPAWCRGLLLVNERTMWVGFTRMRRTKFRENLRWVKAYIPDTRLAKPTHIALFDIVEKKCLKEIELESYGVDTIFSIFPVPEQKRDNESIDPGKQIAIISNDAQSNEHNLQS